MASSPRTLRSFVLASIIALGLVFVANLSPASAVGLSDPGALTVHEGSITVTDDGTIIENLEIRGTLRIEAKNVTVRNVWVYTSNPWTIYVASGSATFTDIEVGHPKIWGLRGIGGSNVVVKNADIHHVEDGIKLGSNATYSGVRVHDLASPEPGPHADAIQVEGTAKNSTVKNSYLSSIGAVGLGNAAVFIKSDIGPQSNLTFVNNYLNGGNYTVYVKDGGHGVPTNITIRGNKFGPDRRYGLTSRHGPIIWEDNTWAATGELIDVDGNVIGAGSVTTTTAPAATTTTAPPATTTTTAPAATTTTAPPATTTTTTTAPPATTTTTVTAATTTTTVSPATTTTTTPPATTTTTTVVILASGTPSDGSGPSAADVTLVLIGAAVMVALSLSFLNARGPDSPI